MVPALPETTGRALFHRPAVHSIRKLNSPPIGKKVICAASIDFLRNEACGEAKNRFNISENTLNVTYRAVHVSG